MKLTVVFFEPDKNSTESDSGCYDSLSGQVAEFDPVYRILKIATGKFDDKGEIIRVIPIADVTDVHGDGIIDVWQP